MTAYDHDVLFREDRRATGVIGRRRTDDIVTVIRPLDQASLRLARENKCIVSASKRIMTAAEKTEAENVRLRQALRSRQRIDLMLVIGLCMLVAACAVFA